VRCTAARGQAVEQRRVEQAAEPSAALLRRDVGRDLAGIAVGGTLAVRTAVGVAQALAVGFGNQPVPAGQGFVDALGEDVRRRHLGLERHRGVFDERRIDRQQGRRVGRRGLAQHGRHARAQRMK
jgi:hypothetical protein